MSNIRVNNITNLDGTSGPVFSGITTIASSSHFVVPRGDTARRNVLENIVGSGLILHVDAKNDISYPGTGTILYDLSPSRNDGTISGATWNSAGYFDFDGVDDYVLFDSASGSLPEVYTFGKEATFDCWFQTTSNSTRQGLVSTHDNSGGSNQDAIDIEISAGGLLNFFMRDVDSGLNQAVATDVPTNTWIHVCGVHDALYHYIYVNGNLINRTTSTGKNNAIPSDTPNFNLGRYYTAYLSGKISVFKSYQRALSAPEVKQNFDALRSRHGV